MDILPNQEEERLLEELVALAFAFQEVHKYPLLSIHHPRQDHLAVDCLGEVLLLENRNMVPMMLVGLLGT